jgi:hypothetical protein
MAAFARDGLYTIITEQPVQSFLRFAVTGSRLLSDGGFTIKVPFTGSKDARVGISTSDYDLQQNGNYPSDIAVQMGFARRYTKVNTLAELEASSGSAFYQNKASQFVWVKYRGGININAYVDPTTEEYDRWYITLIISASP